MNFDLETPCGRRQPAFSPDSPYPSSRFSGIQLKFHPSSPRNPLSPHLRSLQRRPQAPHAKKQIPSSGDNTGFTILDQAWIESYVPLTPEPDPASVSVTVSVSEVQVIMSQLIPGTGYTLFWSDDCRSWHIAEAFELAAEAGEEEIPQSRLLTEPISATGTRFYRLGW